MATKKEIKEYIADELSFLEDILCRPMMGEYLLYYQGQLFGGIYDDCLLVKKTESGKKIIQNIVEKIPYDGAKPMYYIEDLNDKEFLKSLITATCIELKK